MKPIKLEMHALVEVIWADSNFNVGWQPLDLLTAKYPRAMTAGYVTYNDDKVLEVAASLGEMGLKLNPLSIPWLSVTALEVLKAPKPDTFGAPPVPAIAEDEYAQDLPETVEEDADRNFRILQAEILQ